jgi:hypothetical protein
LPDLIRRQFAHLSIIGHAVKRAEKLLVPPPFVLGVALRPLLVEGLDEALDGPAEVRLVPGRGKLKFSVRALRCQASVCNFSFLRVNISLH